MGGWGGVEGEKELQRTELLLQEKKKKKHYERANRGGLTEKQTDVVHVSPSAASCRKKKRSERRCGILTPFFHLSLRWN